MIDKYRIVVGIPMTNVVKNGYYPVTKAAATRWAAIDFVDEVLIVDGHSTDDTVEKHSGLWKVNIVKGPAWDTDVIVNDVNFVNQFNCILETISARDDNTFLINVVSDIIPSNHNEIELRNAIHHMISQKEDYSFIPFTKVLTKSVRESRREQHKSYAMSILRYAPDRKWKNISLKEDSIEAGRKTTQTSFKFREHFLSYESWFFTREHFSWKIKTHFEWNDSWSVDDAIRKIYLNKAERFGCRIMSREEHSLEAQNLIDLLTPDHLGYSLFDNVEIVNENPKK